MERKIKIAIVGVGNCASSLIQGVSYYKRNTRESSGLLYRKIGKYDVSDIEIVAAFDIDKRKVGIPLKKAIFSKPNNTIIFEKNIACGNPIVKMGNILDGFPAHMNDFPIDQRFLVSKEKSCNVILELQKSKADFLICYLPVGSIDAVTFYAKCALAAGVSFINAMPVFIGSNAEWIKKFEQKGLLVIGDDIKSQVGATILHRAIVNLFNERGCEIDSSYQLNIGGNTDFLNMIDKKRLKLKFESKIESVKSQYRKPLNNIYAGPAEYISYLGDNKIAYIDVSGRGFGNLPIKIDLKISVTDSPNSAGVMVDIIRLSKIALDNGIHGTVDEISAFGFKHSFKQFTDGIVFEKLRNWIKKNSR